MPKMPNMPKIRLILIATIAVTIAYALPASADDISAKKIQIKDHATPEKRQAQVQSKDAGLTLAGVDDPGTNGASVHLYSDMDDLCVVLPSGPDWRDTGKLWKYKNKATKNKAQVGDGKLKVKIKSGVTFTLGDASPQGTVNAQVQFGGGTRYCMICTTAKKDDAKKFQAKDCVAATCDAEPSVCDPTVTTTTTTTTMPPPESCYRECFRPVPAGSTTVWASACRAPTRSVPTCGWAPTPAPSWTCKRRK